MLRFLRKLRSRLQAGMKMPPPGHERMYARTDGRTARKHNASGPIYWMSGDINHDRTQLVG